MIDQLIALRRKCRQLTAEAWAQCEEIKLLSVRADQLAEAIQKDIARLNWQNEAIEEA